MALPHPETPRSARRQATRRRLPAAASAAFADRGLHGTTVEDICERAGFTRGAFYSNFTSRDDLVIALVEERSAALRARVAELTRRADLTPDELLHEVLTTWTELPGEREQWLLLQTELMLHAIREPAAGAAWREVVTHNLREIAAVLQAYLGRRGVQLPIDSLVLARLVYATFQGGALQHLLDPAHVAPGDLSGSLVTLLDGALVAGAGAVAEPG
ncbi:TetR/AcrR family transcriptional regulator [Arsenicicoccus dermatophilus]|uniref:TetR/AcrR family transcriptional regulator n=1 Tax=Arsenicicoccus dermatophilus TaxID=1076331 RepID=UPI003916CF9C